MATLNNFDANQVDPSVALDPLPAGKYLAVVSESELKPTKTGGGKYLQLTFQIIDGEFKGRLVWARLNLENRSEMTVKIARGELSAICRAIGVMQPKDSVELHNVPLEINVGLKKRDTNKPTNPSESTNAAQRDERLGKASKKSRQLLVTEIQGLESLFASTKKNSPAKKASSSRKSPCITTRPTISSTIISTRWLSRIRPLAAQF